MRANRLPEYGSTRNSIITWQYLEEPYRSKMIADALMEDRICIPSGGEHWYPCARVTPRRSFCVEKISMKKETVMSKELSDGKFNNRFHLFLFA